MKNLVTFIDPALVTGLATVIINDPLITEVDMVALLDAQESFAARGIPGAAAQWIEAFRKGLADKGYTPTANWADARAHVIDVGVGRIGPIVEAMYAYMNANPMPYLVERAISEVDARIAEIEGMGLPTPAEIAEAEQIIGLKVPLVREREQLLAERTVYEGML